MWREFATQFNYDAKLSDLLANMGWEYIMVKANNIYHSIWVFGKKSPKSPYYIENSLEKEKIKEETNKN